MLQSIRINHFINLQLSICLLTGRVFNCLKCQPLHKHLIFNCQLSIVNFRI